LQYFKIAAYNNFFKLELFMTVIFIHGSGGTGAVWKYQSEHFPDAVMITLPGHPDGKPCLDMRSAAAWLHKQCTGNNYTELVLVGHSLGGGIALQFALDYPGVLKGMVLIGSGARLRVHPATLSALEGLLKTPDEFQNFFNDAWKKLPADFVEAQRASAEVLGPAPTLNDMRICDGFDVVDRLPEIKLPTLLIVGSEDVMTPPKYAEFMRDGIENVSLKLIEGGTHFVFAEQPEEVNEAIETFIATL
jgi:pimeloyl-ACP methyl ester carboxylesterase